MTTKQYIAAHGMPTVPLMGPSQSAAIRRCLRGEEGNWFRARLNVIADRFRDMPKVYEQDGKGDDAIVYLHYFTGAGDWFILERDTSEAQHQAFGLVQLNGPAELGYVSLVELLACPGVELDLHFEPMTLRDVRAKWFTP